MPRRPDQDHFPQPPPHRAAVPPAVGQSETQAGVSISRPVFLEFLKGNWDLECTPWGSPAYNLFGWQRPCYLLDEGYAQSFRELMDETDWSSYGCASGNTKCRDCMVHCGYEPSAVLATFGSLGGLLATARLMLFGPPPRTARTGGAGSAVGYRRVAAPARRRPHRPTLSICRC